MFNLEYPAFWQILSQNDVDKCEHFTTTYNIPVASKWDSTSFVPAMDVHETESEIVFTMDLPGVEPKDLEVRVEGRKLTIGGKWPDKTPPKGSKVLMAERDTGSFKRAFTLTDQVNTESVQAELKNGVLTVKLPRKEDRKAKSIKVTVG